MTLDTEATDVMEDVVSKGVENAGDALVEFVGEKAEVEETEAKQAEAVEIARMGMDEDRLTVVFGLDDGDSGYLVFEFTEDLVVSVIEKIMPSVPDDPLNTMGQSAMNDVSEGMMASLTATVGEEIGADIDHTPPENTDRPLRNIARQVGGEAAVAVARANVVGDRFNVYLVQESDAASEWYG